MPIGGMRLRQWTAVLAIGWSLLALFAGLRAGVEEASRPAPPFALSGIADHQVIYAVTPKAARAGLAPRDRLLAVDGIPIGAWFLRSDRLLGRDGLNRYLVKKPGGQQVEVKLAPLPPGASPFAAGERLIRFGVAVVAFCYLGIGFVVWRIRSERRESWALLLFCAITSSLLFVSGRSSPLVLLLNDLTLPFLGAAGFHLFTTYPVEPRWITRRPGWRTAAYMAAVALSLVSAAWHRYPWPGAQPAFLDPLPIFYALGLMLAGTGIAIFERAHNRRRISVDRADAMLIGAVAGYVPVTFIVLWHYFYGLTFQWTAGLMAGFWFPAAVGYGIVRRDFFDLRVAARSSAAHGAVTLAITGLFALFITSADAAARRFDVDARAPAFSVAFLFFAVLIFNPLRGRVQALVDGFFDRERRAYRRAVREISEAMVSMLSAREVVDRILGALTETMGVERALVLLALQEGDGTLTVVAMRGSWDEDAPEYRLGPNHPICRRLWMQRHELSREDFDEEEDPETREACRDVFDTLDVELLVPILFGVNLLGVIALSRQLAGERFGPDERQFMRTLANQSAIAIENARAFNQVAQLNRTLEARVEARSRELRDTQAQLMQSEKMRSLGQLVAGVAHELNNPIGFVHANLALLEDYVGRLVKPELDSAARARAREAIAKLLSRSREGTERVTQIVRDLRTFSHTDQAELQQVSLNDEIDRTLSLVEPRLRGCLEIERDYGALPPVRCYASQINQVFMNLVMNACDAAAGSDCGGCGHMQIRTRATPEGVLLSFSDDGPGMPPEVLAQIFDPFFTTKPVGQGTGLGLSLSHGIILRHGGEMTVESQPGGGATFRIRLPLAPPAASEAA